MMTTSRMLVVIFACVSAASSATAQEPVVDSTPETAVAAASPETDFVFPPTALANAGGFGQVVGRPAGPPPTPAHTGIKATAREFLIDFKHLPSKENLLWVGVGSGVALAVHPADESFNSHVSGEGWSKVFAVGAVLGNTGTLLAASVTVYTVGRATDNKRVSHMGSDLLQAIGVSE